MSLYLWDLSSLTKVFRELIMDHVSGPSDDLLSFVRVQEIFLNVLINKILLNFSITNLPDAYFSRVSERKNIGFRMIYTIP